MVSVVEETSSSYIPTIKEDSTFEMSKPTENTEKASLRKNRQTLMAIYTRIKYREKVIKAFRKHLKQGTFPKRMKSIRPYPKMTSPEAQAIVNAACDQVQCVSLDQMIQDEEKKLTHDQEHYQGLKVQQLGERQSLKTLKKSQLNTAKKPKKPTIAQLQEELADLHAKYTQLCSKLENNQ